MQSEQSPKLNKSRRVLIVEDMRDQRELIEIALEGEPYELVTTDDGDKGLEIYHQAKREGRKFDLLVTDVRMPEMSGLGLSEAIRGEGDQMAILIMTAFELDVIGDARYKMINPCGMIQKPMGLVELKPIIRDLLRQMDAGLTPRCQGGIGGR